jgi:hypothetical protein
MLRSRVPEDYFRKSITVPFLYYSIWNENKVYRPTRQNRFGTSWFHQLLKILFHNWAPPNQSAIWKYLFPFIKYTNERNAYPVKNKEYYKWIISLCLVNILSIFNSAIDLQYRINQNNWVFLGPVSEVSVSAM